MNAANVGAGVGVGVVGLRVKGSTRPQPSVPILEVASDVAMCTYNQFLILVISYHLDKSHRKPTVQSEPVQSATRRKGAELWKVQK